MALLRSCCSAAAASAVGRNACRPWLECAARSRQRSRPSALQSMDTAGSCAMLAGTGCRVQARTQGRAYSRLVQRQAGEAAAGTAAGTGEPAATIAAFAAALCALIALTDLERSTEDQRAQV